MSKIVRSTQVNYNLALVSTIEGDRQELRILPLVQLTALIFWLYSLFLIVATLDARIQLAVIDVVRSWSPWLSMGVVVVKALWFGVVG
jgi:hypothetical protein